MKFPDKAIKKLNLLNLCLPILLLLSVASCQYSSTFTSAQLTDQAVEYLMENKNPGSSDFNFQSADLLSDSVALFIVINTPNIPSQEADLLQNHYQDQIKESALFEAFLDRNQLESRFKSNRQLDQSKEIYLDSLTTVAVSDKDISNPLGKYLQAGNFLILQVDKWPCTDCLEKKEMRLKLRLVDSLSGYIVWTGIAEKNSLTEEETGNLLVTSQAICDELIDIFYHRFSEKWHRKRFKNLALLAK